MGAAEEDLTHILRWDRPAQVMPREEHEKLYGGDDAPPGAYQPNMSEPDMRSWKAKLCGQRSGDLRVEIRKSAGAGTGYGLVQVLIVVTEEHVRMSMNGTATLTADEFRDLQHAVAEARLALSSFRLTLPHG